MKKVFLSIFIIFALSCLVLSVSYAIKMANPTIINDGTIINNNLSDTIDDNLLKEYTENEPEESLKKEEQKNEWEALNDNHDYDSYDMQNYGGEGNDDGVDENGDTFNPDEEGQ